MLGSKFQNWHILSSYFFFRFMSICQYIYAVFPKMYQNLSITRMTALDEKIVGITSPKRFIRSVSRAYYLSSVLCSIVGLSSCMGLTAIIIICSSSMKFLEFQLICASFNFNCRASLFWPTLKGPLAVLLIPWGITSALSVGKGLVSPQIDDKF